ncbi:MAG TPA: zinc metallopeptidase [Bacilli bacterium]|nr:zinc metallopeptidase [Bacilli bacterium]
MDLILVLGVIFIPLIASIYVKVTYNKYKEVENTKHLSGFEVARKILDQKGLDNIHIVEVRGNLTDHYDSNRKVVRLSTDIFHGETVAAASVAAHEVGHAIQDKEGYFFLKLRSFIYPIVKFCSSISYVVIIIGFLMEATNLIYLGVALVGAGLLFQLITLPVEFDASKKAKANLKKYNLVSKEELEETSSMLNAAAMTYVAGVLGTALQMLRLILIANRRD